MHKNQNTKINIEKLAQVCDPPLWTGSNGSIIEVLLHGTKISKNIKTNK